MSKESLIARNKFLSKNEGRNFFQKQRCYICSNSQFHLINEIDRYGFYYPTGLCKRCGNVQQTKYYDEQVISDFYSNYYRKIYSNDPPEVLFRYQRLGRGKVIYDFVSEIKKTSSVLEVGCGAGGILSVFNDKGCETLGLDFDKRYLDYARKKNIKVLNGSLEMLKKNQKFDLIIMSHVLEHIVNPLDFLENLVKHLKKEGILYLEVPSLELVRDGGFEHDLLNYWQNAHTIHFTVKSLNLLCNQVGLKSIKCTNDIFSCWSLDESKLNINQNELLKSLKYSIDLIREIEENRKNPIKRLKIIFSLFKENLIKVLLRIVSILRIKNLLKNLLKY